MDPNHPSTQSLASMAATSETVLSPTVANRGLILIAWLGTLLLSKLPLVIARDILGTDIPWITSAWIGTAILLFAASYVWQSLRPLRSYFVVLGIIYLWTVLDAVIRRTAIWQNLFAGQPEMVAIFGDRVLLLLNAFLVIAALFLMGVRRRDVFLTVGDLNAPVGGWASPPRRRFLSWSLLGPAMALLLGGLFFDFLISQTSNGLSDTSAIFPWILLILLSAALNAFGEELTFRAATLGMLLPAVSPGHAIWITSLWFGLGHYYGGFPSGMAGLIQSGLLALLLGKAMLDTRGLGWSWMIHMTIDTVIYVFIAMS